MRRKRRTFTAEFKLKVIMEALKERLSLTEMSQKFDLHPNQISKWKTDFIETAKTNLTSSKETKNQDQEVEIEQLYNKIGRLQMEIDFLKKKLY
jgi:transposase-like protein